MPRPVSIIVWRDAKADPPTGDMSRFVLWTDGGGHCDMIGADEVANRVVMPPGEWWAEEPILSDLTDEDVRNVALWALDGEVLATGTHNAADRLRAALGDS